MDTAQFELHSRIEQRHWWFVARRKILRRIADEALLGRDPNVRPTAIDIGCGTGANIAAFADGYRCIGIDTSPEAIGPAKQAFPDVRFIHGYAPDDLGDDLRNADLVMLNDVLEHVRDDFLLLSRVMAELKPGAICLLTVPADMSLWSPHDVSFGHYRRYDRTRFESIWSGLPVRPRLVTHFNARLYPIIKTIRTLNRFRGKAAGAAGTDFSLPVKPVNRLLESCFAGEAEILLRAMRTGRASFSRGASQLAVLERLPGKIQVRSKPRDLARDYFDPELVGARG